MSVRSNFPVLIFSVSDLCTRSMCNSVGFLPVQFHVVPRSNITDWLTFLSLSPTIIHILALFYGTSCIYSMHLIVLLMMIDGLYYSQASRRGGLLFYLCPFISLKQLFLSYIFLGKYS